MIIKIINYLKKVKYNKKKVKIGQNTRILCGWSNFGSEPYLVEIGSDCTITSGVHFITHDGSIDVPFNLKKRSRWKDEKKYEKIGKIVVEDNCFIGVNAIIMPGVKIEKNSIVAAGAVVTKNVPSGKIVAGNPAVIIGDIEKYAEKIEGKLFLIDHNRKEFDIIKKLS